MSIMSPKHLLQLIFCTTLINIIKSQSPYPFQTWMEDWSTADAATYGVSIESSTIFDITLPGANRAGMSFTSSDTNSLSANPILDQYVSTLNFFETMQEKQSWAARQKGSVYQLLMSGVRFLDLRLQHDIDTDEYYSYNGLLGNTVTEIILDINNFLTDVGTKEIVLIYLHDFMYSEFDSIASADALKMALMDKFVTTLSSKLANSAADNINQRTIKQLIDGNVQIIMFSDDANPGGSYTNSDYFYDASTYLFIPTGNTNINSNVTYGPLDETKELRSYIINNIRYGWPDHRLNLIYWTLEIGSSFTERFVYDSMQQLSAPANTELNSVLSLYNKLWFANIIIIDFMETTDIMQRIITLNYQYSICRDALWGNNMTACPYLTRLDSKYFTTDISPFCSINTYLQNASWCPRSCGTCPSKVPSDGIPGDTCAANGDCNSVLYDFYNEPGECFIRPTDARSEDNIGQESFCLSLDAQLSCANKEIKDKCAGDSSTGIDVSQCAAYCSSNWQCRDGYCNTQYSVCMTLLESITSTAVPEPAGNGPQYDFASSEGAEAMLRDVAVFRPGDYKATPNFSQTECDSFGADCLFDGMDANPYLASLLGFALIPFIMANLLCFCYTFFCFPCWCCCDQCAKRCCCCHRVMKDPREDGDKCRQWTPFAFLVACLILIVWACIEGIVNNAEMHDHIFADTNSVKYAINNLFSEVIERFEAVEPTAEYIIDFGMDIINDVFAIAERNTDSVGGVMDGLYADLSMVQSNYSNGVSINGTFVNPFNVNGSFPDQSFTVECPYCNTIADTARDMKAQLNSSIGAQLGDIDGLMNQTRQLVDAKELIKNLTQVLFDTLNDVINTSNSIQTIANEYIDLGAKYDQTYRKEPAQIFFIIPMGLIIFVVAGVLMKNKWCFKCEWFCAMYCCGIPIMLLSWPFIFFAVLWGDLCVRLDDFEQNLGQSQIGRLAMLDNVSANSPEALGMALVNTCWHGGSPLNLFNLTDTLDWDAMRAQMDEVLDIDITGLLEGANIDSFQTEMESLSVSEFVGEVDGFIAHANSIGSYCGCGAANRPFTRLNLYTPPSFNYCATYEAPNANGTQPTLPVVPFNFSYLTPSMSVYWYNTSIHDGGACQKAFINASAAVQIQTALTDVANSKIADVKQVFTESVFASYDDLYAIALTLESDIASISCLVDPLFEQFDVILDNFTNCGFLGEAYGNFKEAGCVNLFDDWYKIARALAIIAYISIVIVFMSLCMDYIYGPVTKRQPSQLEDEIVAADDGSEIVMEYAPNTTTGQGDIGGGGQMMYGNTNNNAVELVVPQNYNDAPGSRYRVGSHSNISAGSAAQPPPPSEHAPPSYQSYVDKPVFAESEVISYQVGYDNEPKPAASNVNELEVIQQENEGGVTNETGKDPEFEPVVPLDDNIMIGSDDEFKPVAPLESNIVIGKHPGFEPVMSVEHSIDIAENEKAVVLDENVEVVDESESDED